MATLRLLKQCRSRASSFRNGDHGRNMKRRDTLRQAKRRGRRSRKENHSLNRRRRRDDSAGVAHTQYLYCHDERNSYEIDEIAAYLNSKTMLSAQIKL